MSVRFSTLYYLSIFYYILSLSTEVRMVVLFLLPFCFMSVWKYVIGSKKTNSEHIDGSCPAVFVLLRCTEDYSPGGPQGKRLFLVLYRALLYMLVTLFPHRPRNQPQIQS